MAILGATQFLERLQFFNGQRLLASDLQSLESYNREMRELHNITMHASGVGSGYAVSGNKGDRQVTISPGYAIDACGREIVLTETDIEPVPPVAGDGQGNPVYYDLAVSYPLDADLTPSETRDGICLPQGVVRLREAPNFCWLELGADFQPKDPRLKAELQSSMRILLARAEIKNCRLNQPLSVTQRRNARPPSQPHIACGSTDPNAGGWSAIPSNAPTGGDAPTFLGLEIDVDTSAARFQIPPSYSAQLAGERIFSGSFPGFNADGQYVLDGYVNITNAAAKGFTLQLLMPFGFNVGFPLNPQNFLLAFSTAAVQGSALLATNNWTVVWMGVES
jgi:hypothetical protein